MANTYFKLLWSFRIINFTRVSILSIVICILSIGKVKIIIKVLQVHSSSFKKNKTWHIFILKYKKNLNINSISVILNSIFVPILFTFTSIIDDVIIERFDVDNEPVRKIWNEVLQFSSYRMLRVRVANLSPALSFKDIYILSLVCVRLSYWQ